MAAARRIRINVAYDGGAYHGWQVQPELPTIQGALEAAISEIEGKPVPVAGSGRTDAGVHALAQVAAFALENPIPLPNLKKAMNRLLPHDIRVLEVREAPAGFHPRFDAVAKTYEYRILRAEVCRPFDRAYVYHFPFPMDVDRFLAAAPVFEGEHDFSAFAAADEKDVMGYSKVRTIFSSRAAFADELLAYRVRGSGFLKHMVRNLVGALIEAAKGNLEISDLERMLLPGAKKPFCPTVPARGLFLVSVEYP